MLDAAHAASPASVRSLRRYSVAVMLRELVRVSPALTIAFLLAAVGAAIAPLGLAVALSRLVGNISAAVAGGGRSAAAHRVDVALLAIAGFLVAQQVLTATQGVMTTRLSNVLAPYGTGHLEDPAMLDLVTDASRVGTSWISAGNAMYALQGVLATYLGGTAMLIGVARFSWLGALALLVVWLFVRSRVRRENLELWKVLASNSAGTRRSEYYRSLALTQPAAKEIRIFGLGDWITDRFQDHWLASMSAVWRGRRDQRARLALLLALLVVVQVLVLGDLLWAAKSGRADIATVTLVLQGVVGAAVLGGTGDVNDVMLNWGAATVPALERLERALGNGPRQEARPGTAGASRVVDPPPWTGLRLEKVAYRYPGQNADALRSVDLELRPGRSLALVGHNGAGKTTLVKLICRLTEPGHGRLLLGDVDLRDVDPAAWRRHVAVVFQDFVHYPVSALENVRFGAVDAGLDAATLAEVAELSGLSRFIDTLSRGWETELTQEVAGGTGLSGGQWQSVALARALYAVRAGARLLILDEPTANLDVRAEATFYARFLEITRGVTTVIVSHRFSTVRRADEICVLEEGRITARGNHEQLVAEGGLYARMFALQAEPYLEAGDA
jgi:ATP-binding cassette, subfamily B, bacterial